MTAVADIPKIEPQRHLSEHAVRIGTIPTFSQSTTIPMPRTPARLTTVSSSIYRSQWFRPVLSQFEQMLSLPMGWDSYDGLPTSLASVEKALYFLARVAEPQTSPPTVVPLSGGGVQLVWHENGVDVEATFTADESEVYVRDLGPGHEYEGDPVEDETRAVLQGVLERLRA